jgi:hypothetical protein
MGGGGDGGYAVCSFPMGKNRLRLQSTSVAWEYALQRSATARDTGELTADQTDNMRKALKRSGIARGTGYGRVKTGSEMCENAHPLNRFIELALWFCATMVNIYALTVQYSTVQYSSKTIQLFQY